MPLQRLADNPRPTYLPLLPAAPRRRGAREPRDDLVLAALPCCGEEVKVAPGWAGALRCPRCGALHAGATTAQHPRTATPHRHPGRA